MTHGEARLGTRTARWVLRLAIGGAVALALFAGVVGGLLRAGSAVPGVAGAWLGQAVSAHAFLMICAFMGTVIGIERAVAVKVAWSYAGPVLSAAAGVAVLAGEPDVAKVLAGLASLLFVAVNALVAARQPAAHTLALLLGALAWAIGTTGYALGARTGGVLPWWFAFLVLTIAAERLEMTRLMKRRRRAPALLGGILAALLLGAALAAAWPRAGGAVYGLALAALAVWLLVFDIARRTVHAAGLSRYMAVCLLLGYGWLLVAGLAWVGVVAGLPCKDLALHALGLGFVVSMMLGHAPVILPAVARVKVLFGWVYYLPLALLHLSLVVRLAWGWLDGAALAVGAAGNALALLLFALTVAGSAAAWRLRHPPRAPRRPARPPGPLPKPTP